MVKKVWLFLLAWSFQFCLQQSIAESKSFQIKNFLKKQCYECHGMDKQEGEVRLDNLSLSFEGYENIELWQMVLDQLNLNEMPPQKKPRPDEEETRKVIEFLTVQLSDAYQSAKSTNRQTVLRRLNRYELRNTLRDLLFLKGSDFEPGARGGQAG